VSSKAISVLTQVLRKEIRGGEEVPRREEKKEGITVC